MLEIKNKFLTGYKFIDLFCGIGGFHLALSSFGASCVFASDIDYYAQTSYQKNFGIVPYGDITKIIVKDIPHHDILCAGFPCQPFSISGNRKGFDDDQGRGKLFFNIIAIIHEHFPKMVLLENVKNLCSHDKGRTFQVIRESLDELDYEIFYKVLDGQNYVPQHRERILIVGFDRERYGDKIDFEFNLTPRVPKPVMRDILDEEVADKYTLSDKLWTYLQNYAAKHRAAGNGFGYGIAPLDGVSRTLSARYYKDGSEVLIAQEGKNPRRLTPRECARLQGFPDTFKIPVSDTQAYKQFGNSVVVPLMGEVAKLIVDEIERLDKEGAEWKQVI